MEQSFVVPAPPERAWALLNDVPRIVPCMPGAELDEIVGENAWKATMHVKLGPIALAFGTEVSREEMDEAAGRVVLQAKARELKGRGGAQARIESTLAEAEGGTQVAIVTELTLQGPVAQYGRGVVADVASQLTKRFADCVAALLAESGEGAAPAAPAEAKPVGGLRLGLAALWRALLSLLRLRRREGGSP